MTKIETLKMRWGNVKRLINWQLDKPAFKCKFCSGWVEKETLCPQCGWGQEVPVARHDLLTLLEYIEYLEKAENLLKNIHNHDDEIPIYEGTKLEALIYDIQDYFNEKKS